VEGLEGLTRLLPITVQRMPVALSSAVPALPGSTIKKLTNAKSTRTALPGQTAAAFGVMASTAPTTPASVTRIALTTNRANAASQQLTTPQTNVWVAIVGLILIAGQTDIAHLAYSESPAQSLPGQVTATTATRNRTSA
jgi:hypothetical protein